MNLDESTKALLTPEVMRDVEAIIADGVAKRVRDKFQKRVDAAFHQAIYGRGTNKPRGIITKGE